MFSAFVSTIGRRQLKSLASLHSLPKDVVGIGYLDDIEKGHATIKAVLDKTEGVLPEPEPWIYISKLATSSVNFTVYFWVVSNQAKGLKVSDKVATGIKYALDEAGIDMPYPHNVVMFDDATGMQKGDIVKAKDLGLQTGGKRAANEI